MKSILEAVKQDRREAGSGDERSGARTPRGPVRFYAIKFITAKISAAQFYDNLSALRAVDVDVTSCRIDISILASSIPERQSLVL